MGRYSLQEFLTTTAQDDAAREKFELENPHLLELNLDGRVWAKSGSMIAYTGQVKFTREGIAERGIGHMFKKALTGEGATLMKVEGRGRVYLAEKGKKIRILELEDQPIVVNGNDLLAFEDTIRYDFTVMRSAAGLLAGGLFNVRLEGRGLVAITTHYEPLTLRVTPGQTVFTDPNATVAWSASLSPQVHTDISFKTFLGRGSGESIQLRFDGEGWVVMQPYEEVYLQAKG
jgi:uncharacterized protein (AIM24 family)